MWYYYFVRNNAQIHFFSKTILSTKLNSFYSEVSHIHETQGRTTLLQVGHKNDKMWSLRSKLKTGKTDCQKYI